MGEKACPDGVVAVRSGGALALFADATVSPAALSSADLAVNAAAVIAGILGRESPLLYARQDHTTLSFTYSAEGSLGPGPHLVGVCDALITAEPDIALLVRTADCLPIVLLGDEVAAVVHAGWRGLAGDILGAATRRLRAEFGVEPGSLEAVIGVGIGPCHYVVGDDVRAALSRIEVDSGGWQLDDRVDLAEFARGRLRVLGVRDCAVTTLAGCTACSTRHHSHRRDGERAGRQWAAVVRPGD